MIDQRSWQSPARTVKSPGGPALEGSGAVPWEAAPRPMKPIPTRMSDNKTEFHRDFINPSQKTENCSGLVFRTLGLLDNSNHRQSSPVQTAYRGHEDAAD